MRRLVAQGELDTCAIVWHELVYGAARLPRSRKRRVLEAYLEENDLVLVTSNLREFRRFQGLRLEDWRRG